MTAFSRPTEHLLERDLKKKCQNVEKKLHKEWLLTAFVCSSYRGSAASMQQKEEEDKYYKRVEAACKRPLFT